MKTEIKIIIDDGYVSYSYPISVDSKNSIETLADKIYIALDAEKQNGVKVSDNQRELLQQMEHISKRQMNAECFIADIINIKWYKLCFLKNKAKAFITNVIKNDKFK